MKSSRAMLLAVLLFSAPVSAVLAEDTTSTGQAAPVVKTEPGMLSKAKDLALAPFVFVLATAPDVIAKNTLGRIASMNCLKDSRVGAFIGNEWTGRVVVLGAAFLTAMKLYKLANDDVDANDDEIFGDDNNN